jgi:hypothetical protein
VEIEVKLTSLRPAWARRGADHGRKGLGVIFDCPCCFAERVLVWFAVPLDGGASAPLARTRNCDNRVRSIGDTFEALTILNGLNVIGHLALRVDNGMVRSA